MAKKLAEKLSYKFICFDETVWQVSKRDKLYDENDNLLLSMDEVLKVYNSMHDKAKSLLKKGKNVILDSMYFKKQRDEAVEIAKECKTLFYLIEVTCKESIIKRRLEKRKTQVPQSPGFKLYLKYRDNFEPEESKHITIDTSYKSVEECVSEVITTVFN